MAPAVEGSGGTATASNAGSASVGSGGGGSGASASLPACIPREGCQQLCASLGDDPASCGVGDREQCGCICEERFNGPCPEALQALLACTGDSPSIDCSVRGRVFPGCEAESIELELCDFQAREQLCAQPFPRCTPYCTSLTSSFCAQGPESVTSCLCGCEATLVVACAVEFAAFMDCSADAPVFACEAGAPEPAGCGVQWQALDVCSRGGAAAAVDAGG